MSEPEDVQPTNMEDPNVKNSDLTPIGGVPRGLILDANTFEAHIWLAQRALDAEELNLASAHIRLARELQNAVANRAMRAREVRNAARAWNASSEQRRAAIAGVNARTRDRCVKCGRPGDQRIRRVDPQTPKEDAALPGATYWVHIDSLGYALPSDHPFTLHV